MTQDKFDRKMGVLINELNELKNFDFSNMPIMVAKTAIRKELVARGWGADVASVIVVKMDINVDERAVNHPRFDELIKVFVDVVVKVHTTCVNDFGTRCIDAVFDAIVRDFSLSLVE